MHKIIIVTVEIGLKHVFVKQVWHQGFLINFCMIDIILNIKKVST